MWPSNQPQQSFIFGGGGGGSVTPGTNNSVWVQIAKTVLGAPANNVTFSNISGNYTDLVLTYTARSALAAQNVDTVDIQFNGDAGNNYGRQFLSVQGTGVVGNTQTPAVASILSSLVPAASATATYAGVSKFLIPGYSANNFFKTAMVLNFSGPPAGASQGEFFVSGTWANNAAITSIKVFLDSANNFLANSTFVLYGVF